jgi:hypothetical protein
MCCTKTFLNHIFDTHSVLTLLMAFSSCSCKTSYFRVPILLERTFFG